MLDPWQVATGCMTMLCGLLVWIGRTHISRVDAHAKTLAGHGERLTRMEVVQLTPQGLREELRAMETRLAETLRQAQGYTAERIGRLEGEIDATKDRLDAEIERRRHGPGR